MAESCGQAIKFVGYVLDTKSGREYPCLVDLKTEGIETFDDIAVVLQTVMFRYREDSETKVTYISPDSQRFFEFGRDEREAFNAALRESLDTRLVRI